MNRRGMLIVVSGPSGVGKDTVVNGYLEDHPNAIESVSATTRAPRTGEQDGVNYFFVTREKFEQLLADEQMLEHAQYNENYYGTPRQMVETNRAAGKHVLLVIDVQGALQIQKLVPEAVLVFIAPPSIDCLSQRLTGRGTDSDQAILRRLQAAHAELKQAEAYDYIIENCKIEQAVEDFSTVIAAAERSPKHMPELLRGVLELC